MTITQTGRRVALVGMLALFASVLPFSGASAIDGDIARQLSGDTNVAISIANSQVVYTPTPPATPPTTALIGRADNFADNLAAGALQGAAAGDAGAPLLLTASDALDPAVGDELTRLGVTAVTVLGGEAAISETVVTEIEAITGADSVTRYAGATRTETAIAIAEASGATTALLVRNAAAPDSTDDTQAFADALGAGALAATEGYSVLFTQTDVLTGNTAAYLSGETGPDTVIIVGGPLAVSAEVQTEVEGIVGADNVSRIAGADRFETAVALNEARTGTDPVSFAIAVDGQSDDAWADGFTMANLSGNGNYPLVLTNQGMVPQATEDYLTSINENAFAAHLDDDVFLICGATTGDACAELAALYGLTVVPFPAPPEPPPAGGVVVDVDNNVGVPDDSSYTYVVDGASEATVVDVAEEQLDDDGTDDDEFVVDGNPASAAVFFTSIMVCDQVQYEAGAAANGNDLHTLDTTPECDDITSGVVGGGLDVGTGDFDIIEPVTGTILNGPLNWTGPDTSHIVDGGDVDEATFADEINAGDTIVITELDSGVTEYALTNETVTGSVEDLTIGGGVSSFLIGAFGNDLVGGTHFEASNPAAPGTEVYMVNGDVVEYDGCVDPEVCFEDNISEDDEISYSRTGDEETFDLTDIAPPTVEGIGAAAGGVDGPTDLTGMGGTIEFLSADADTPTTFDYTSDSIFRIGNQTVLEAAWELAYNEGDTVSHVDADEATGTAELTVLVNNTPSLGAFLSGADTGAQVITLDRDGNDGDGNLFADFDYATSGMVGEFEAVGSTLYQIDGAPTSLALFEDALDDVDFATDAPEIEITQDAGNAIRTINLIPNAA